MIPQTNHYRDFKEEDFLTDPHFQDWVTAPSTAGNEYWQQLMVEFPDKVNPIENARQLLTHLNFPEHFPSADLIRERYLDYQQRVEALKAQVGEVTTMPGVESLSPRSTVTPLWQTVIRLAAVVTGLILVSYLVIQLTSSGTTRTWNTAYGELQTVYLPDSTMVVLNSKSQLRISNWKNDEAREVWLDGEAFFDVRHIAVKNSESPEESTMPGRLPFTVHTSQLRIEVLGTAFDIRERRGLTEVVLQRGSINCRIPAKKDQLMQAGERIVYTAAANSITRTRVDANEYLQWRERKLLLVDPTAGEICQYLEDNFGKRIVFEDSALQHKKIEGPIMINNLDDALFVISTVLDAKIKKTDSLVIIKQNTRSH